ncbi:MAG: branched-chain amino acid transport system II carrier protein, partial [Oscillospiraceae bacterium]
MEKLSTKNTLLIGVTLFSMFFGAGNLIFPPFLGAQAGTQTITALIGFCITAIGFPVLGVVVVAKSGGLTALARRVHPLFAT